MSYEAAVHAQAIEIDKLSLEMCAAAGSGHPTSAASIAHIVTVLLYSAMRWSPDFPDYLAKTLLTSQLALAQKNIGFAS